MNCDPMDELIESGMAMSNDEIYDDCDIFDKYDDPDEAQEQHSQFPSKIERKALDLRCSPELATYIDELKYQVCLLSAKLDHTSNQVNQLKEMLKKMYQAQETNKYSDEHKTKSQKSNVQEIKIDNFSFDDLPF